MAGKKKEAPKETPKAPTLKTASGKLALTQMEQIGSMGAAIVAALKTDGNRKVSTLAVELKALRDYARDLHGSGSLQYKRVHNYLNALNQAIKNKASTTCGQFAARMETLGTTSVQSVTWGKAKTTTTRRKISKTGKQAAEVAIVATSTPRAADAPPYVAAGDMADREGAGDVHSFGVAVAEDIQKLGKAHEMPTALILTMCDAIRKLAAHHITTACAVIVKEEKTEEAQKATA